MAVNTPASHALESTQTAKQNSKNVLDDIAKYKNYLNIAYDLSYRCSMKPLRSQYCSVLLSEVVSSETTSAASTEVEDRLTVHYIGDGSQLSYVKSLCFDNDVVESDYKTISLTALLKSQFPTAQAALRVYDFDFPVHSVLGLNGIKMPYWLKQKITLPDNWDEYLAGMRRKTRREAQRMIRKFELTTAIVDGKEYGESFYDQLYKPYIERRHGDSSVIIDKPEFLKRISNSDIIQLLFEGEVIAAAQLNLGGDTLAIGWTGVREQGLRKELRGAADALDYFCVEYAFQQNCSAIDMGHSRPVLSDGILRYKKKWGANINTGVVPQGSLVFQPTELTRSCKAFYCDNTLLSAGAQGLAAHLLLTDEQQDEDVSSLLKDLYLQGLSEIIVYADTARSWADFSMPDCTVTQKLYGDTNEALDLLAGVK